MARFLSLLFAVATFAAIGPIGAIATFAAIATLGWRADAQVKKMDLDDLTIKGELHGDDRLMIFSRQKNEMQNFVKFRKNYRSEILQQLPEKSPKRDF